MASTYSTDYQITLMTTGEEAGSWGGITNDNLEKVGNSVGGSVVVNVTTPPTGGSWDGGTYVMNWVTENTSAKGTSGTSPVGSGRARFVVFADSGAMGDDITVNICGNTSSDKPERVFFAKNSLSASRSITFKLAGSGSYVLANGKTALLFTNSVAKGTGDEIAADTVANILDALQVTSLTLQNGETISNAVDGTVAIDGATLKVGDGAAIATVRSSGAYDLELRAGDTDKAKIVVVDDTNGSISLEPDGTGVVTVAGAATGLVVSGSKGIALETSGTIKNSSGSTIAFNGPITSGAVTSTGAVQGTSLTDGTATLSSGSLASAVNVTASGTITDGAFSTTAGAVTGVTTLTATGLAKVVGLQLNAADQYINFSTATAGSGSYGLWDNSGVIKSKNTGGSWLQIAQTVVGAITAASDTTNGSPKQGSFDIGPLRFIFNTIGWTGIGASGVTVTLGDSGDGTDFSMDSDIYFVLAVSAENTDRNSNFMVYRSSATQFVINNGDGSGEGSATGKATYLAVGDSDL